MICVIAPAPDRAGEPRITSLRFSCRGGRNLTDAWDLDHDHVKAYLDKFRGTEPLDYVFTSINIKLLDNNVPLRTCRVRRNSLGQQKFYQEDVKRGLWTYWDV